MAVQQKTTKELAAVRWRIVGVDSWNRTVELGGRCAQCEVRPTTASDFIWRVSLPDGKGPASSVGGVAKSARSAKLRAMQSAKSNLTFRAREYA